MAQQLLVNKQEKVEQWQSLPVLEPKTQGTSSSNKVDCYLPPLHAEEDPDEEKNHFSDLMHTPTPRQVTTGPLTENNFSLLPEAKLKPYFLWRKLDPLSKSL